MDMVNAIAEIQKILASLSKLFRGAGEGMDAAVTARVQDFIEKYGRVSKKEIFKALHRHLNSPETLDRILYVLEAIGYCTVVNSNKMTFYQPVAKKVGP
jgi:hypothetical protein